MRLGARLACGTLVLTGTGAALGTAASCSYGNYDGTFDAASLETGTADVAPPPVTQAIPPAGAATLRTADQIFELDVPASAFEDAVTITITYLGDRVLPDAQLSVPRYLVAVVPAQAPALPLQVVFHGGTNGAQPGPGTVLVPTVVDGAQPEAPLTVVGESPLGGGGPNNTSSYWGLTATAGIFSLAFDQGVTNGSPLQERSADACLVKCCGAQSSGGGSSSAFATTNGCYCGSSAPNLQCFLDNCKGAPASAAGRCLDIAGTRAVQGQVVCGSTHCPGGQGSGCCINKAQSPSNPQQCGSNPSCSMYAVCTSDANCPQGATCCADDSTTYCSMSCPAGHHVCIPNGDAGVAACDGGACNASPTCGFGTCSAVPAGCR